LDFTIFLAVLAAALLHASWNLIVKLNLDRFLALFLLQTLMGIMGAAMLFVFAWPKATSLPFAVISGLLHTGYNIFLARSYRTGDLSQVDPIARGSAPLLTLAATWLVVGEAVTPLAAAGIAALTAGIWATGFSGGKALRLDGMTLFFALGTSAFIAAYTIVDGLGGRASGSASGYTAFVFVLDAMFLNIAALFLRGPAIYRLVAPWWKSGLLGAALSAAAYWIVIWAMTKAPIAAVAALRETSILFVIAMSVWVLKERVTWPRMAGTALIVAGAAALRFS
jgi:drug/metabolite transporter (DMT)-like permease